MNTKFFPCTHLDWSARKVCVCGLLGKMVEIEEGSLEYKQIVNLTNLLKQKSSAIAFSFAGFLHFFNDPFLLFVPASAIANHKTTTEADVLNKIAGELKFAPNKIVAGGREKSVNNVKKTEYFKLI